MTWQLLNAANRIFWFGDAEIIIGPCESVATTPNAEVSGGGPLTQPETAVATRHPLH